MRPQSLRGQPQYKGGKELQARDTIQNEGREDGGRGHSPHLVELSPSMADSISSSQSSSRRPLGDALLELEPPAVSPQGPSCLDPQTKATSAGVRPAQKLEKHLSLPPPTR